MIENLQKLNPWGDHFDVTILKIFDKLRSSARPQDNKIGNKNAFIEFRFNNSTKKYFLERNVSVWNSTMDAQNPWKLKNNNN